MGWLLRWCWQGAGIDGVEKSGEKYSPVSECSRYQQGALCLSRLIHVRLNHFHNCLIFSMLDLRPGKRNVDIVNVIGQSVIYIQILIAVIQNECSVHIRISFGSKVSSLRYVTQSFGVFTLFPHFVLVSTLPCLATSCLTKCSPGVLGGVNEGISLFVCPDFSDNIVICLIL